MTRLFFIILLGFCAGAIIGQAGVYTALTKQDAIETTKNYDSYIFEIIEDEQKGSYGSSCLAQTKLLNGEEVKVQLNFKKESATLRFGHLICAKTSIELPRESSLPYMWSKGVIATADIYSYENHERSDFFGLLITFRDNALACLGSDSDSGTALLKALLLGERAELDEDGFYQDIRSVGLAHLVAVSGAHLVIVSGSLKILLSMFKVPRRGIIVFQVVFLLLYLILIGMPVSAMRAACMSLVSFLSFFPGRRSSALNALGICIMVMAAINPWSAISISFLLSSLSTLGIIMLIGLFAHWSQHFFPSFPSHSMKASH